MIYIDEKRFVEAADDGELDAVIIPTASNYHKIVTPEQNEKDFTPLPDTMVWFIRNYLQRLDVDNIYKAAAAFAALTPTSRECCVLSEAVTKEFPARSRHIKPYNKAISSCEIPVIALSVTSTYDPKHESSGACSYHQSSSFLNMDSIAVIEMSIVKALRFALREIPHYRHMPNLYSIGIAPLFLPDGFHSNSDHTRYATPRAYTELMLGILDIIEIPVNVRLYTR